MWTWSGELSAELHSSHRGGQLLGKNGLFGQAVCFCRGTESSFQAPAFLKLVESRRRLELCLFSELRVCSAASAEGCCNSRCVLRQHRDFYGFWTSVVHSLGPLSTWWWNTKLLLSCEPPAHAGDISCSKQTCCVYVWWQIRFVLLFVASWRAGIRGSRLRDQALLHYGNVT